MTKKNKYTRPHPISNIKYLKDHQKLWLNPVYQRESVWTLSQKQLFVDSLFKGIDIPKLYFRETENGEHELEVVDGQQRIRALCDFMDDGFKMPKDSDDVDDYRVAGLRFSDLDTDLQMQLRNVTLDVVEMNIAYTDDDIEEIFLRLQNGTPLNAAEKRRAIAGTMRNVVAELSKHKIFSLCSFNDKRFAYEDAAAKSMHLLLAGTITDIRPSSIKRTYERNCSINSSDRRARNLKRAYSFLTSAFKNEQSPRLKKYSVITLSYLVAELLDTYNVSKHKTEFAQCFLDFEVRRITNQELPEEDQDSALAAYTDAARSDSIPSMRYRHEILRSVVLDYIPELLLKDESRFFSEEQRLAIFRKNKGICQKCKVNCDDSDFHADHIEAHSKGGKTNVKNGQVLCPKCNLAKGDRS